jgi:hypothetical protein
LGFSPDFLWFKTRNTNSQHALYDVIRGVSKSLVTNSTAAEATEGGGLASFDSAGFSLSGDNTIQGSTNGSGRTYVTWAWDAGSSTVTNTQGSISSQVRANASAGFSIVTWTQTGSSGDTPTVGHGLGVAPSLILTKNRGGAVDWRSYHASLGVNKVIWLNSTLGAGDIGSPPGWSISSTTFGMKNGQVVDSGNSMVAYCFAPVAGYANAFSYSGNGSSDGPMVWLGFRPRFIIQKRTDSAGSWLLIDTARDPVNVARNEMFANSSAAEYDNGSLIDVLSNGFKIRASFANMNASGGSFIGFAFAESPFQYARAR